MPKSREVLPGYTGVRGFEVVPLEGHDRFLEGVKKSGLFEAIHDLAYNLKELGWAPQNAGNTSVRYEKHHTSFAITASESNFADIQDDDIVHVGLIEIIVGKERLPIGANYGIDGELNLWRVVKALDNQGLLEKTKKDLGVEFELPDNWNHELLEEGYNLMERLGITPAKLVGHETRDEYAKKKGLSPRERQALEIAYHCENIPLYHIYGTDIEDRNHLIRQSGLTLSRLISYLGSKNLLKCKVEAIVPEGRKPSSETLSHGLIYANRWQGNSQVNAVVHCHAPNITKMPPKGLAQTALSAIDAGYGTLDVAVDCLESMKDDAGVLLRDHGPVVVTGNWQIMIPTKREGYYALGQGGRGMFEDCFGHLKQLDKRARMPAIFRRFMNFFTN